MSSGAPKSPIGMRCRARSRALSLGMTRMAHGRQDDAGMDRIAAHLVALARAVDRHRLGELPHRALAGAVGRQVRRAEEGRQRRGVDDRAAARLPHRRHAVLAAQEHALDVDRQHAPPLLERLGLEGRRKGPEMPALLTRPFELALARQDAVDDALPVGFARRCRAPRSAPCRRSAARSPARPARLMSVTITVAPSLASSAAVARPMPDPAPLTSTTLSATRLMRSFPELS